MTEFKGMRGNFRDFQEHDCMPLDGPSLPYHGGGKYVFNSADDLRAGYNPLGPSEAAEINRARKRVERALGEIEERDTYLADIKAQIIWAMGWTYPPGLAIICNHEFLRQMMEETSLRRDAAADKGLEEV